MLFNPPIGKGKDYFRENVPVLINIVNMNKKFKENKAYLHNHDFIEIAYVYSGQGSHIIENRHIPVFKGDLFIIDYGTSHVFLPYMDDKNGDLIIYNCIFNPEFIDYSLIHSTDFKDVAGSVLFNAFYMEEKPALYLKLSGMDQTNIEDVYRRMHSEYTGLEKGYVNILRSFVIELLTKIFRIIESGVDRSNMNNNKFTMIKISLDFLKENYSACDLNINEVALRSFLSKSYFSKLFKEATGQNYSDYLQNLRISEACKMLKTTDKKVIEIIEDVGFKDTKHFNALFKKITGKTPREYRRSAD